MSSPQPGLREFERDVRAVKSLGAAWVRFGVVGHQVVSKWSDSGRIVFNPDRLSLYEDAFDFVESLDMNVCLLTVDGMPTKKNSPEYADVMTQYWGELAQRLGSRVPVWQVYNEASDSDFRTAGSIQGSLDDYLSDLNDMLGLARQAIHEHAPSVRITTSAGGYPIDDEKEAAWMRFFSGVRSHLDLCTVDLYPVVSDTAISSLPERLDRLEASQGLPIAVGEFGLQTGPELYTESQQAESLTKTMEAVSRTHAEPVFVYRLRDDGAVNDDGFGIYEIDGTPKSSVPRVADAIAASYPNG